jgi:hypothetical protein
MAGKNEDSDTWRGYIMRRMAAIHAEIDRLASAEMSTERSATRIEELKEQLAALMKKFLA